MARGATLESSGEGWSKAQGLESYPRLNLGSGGHNLEGALNLDINPRVDPDIVCDLESFPWSGRRRTGEPWTAPTDGFAEVRLNHFLEHIGPYLEFMAELYRVCMHGAKLEVCVPYYSHANAIADPTHKRLFSERSFAYLDARARKVIGVEHYNFPFDFELAHLRYVYEDSFQAYAQVACEHARVHNINVVIEMSVMLQVHKPMRKV